MRVVFNRYLLSAITLLCVTTLSACGGGGTSVPEPPTPRLVELEAPEQHGLSAGELRVDPGATEEHGNVVVTCSSSGGACVLIVADDGSVSYEDTGGVPIVAYPPRRLPGALNAYSLVARRNVAGRVARTAFTDVASSTASTTSERPLAGGTWNTGVTQASLNADPDSPRDNRAINAWYINDRLVFERIELEQGFRPNTRRTPPSPGYLAEVSPPAGIGDWQGVEQFFITDDGARFYSVFYSDVLDNADSDYLAFGYWAWLPGPDIDRRPFVGAAASGNDPFIAGHVNAVDGQATYRGAATGLYVDGRTSPAYRVFDADVRLTADFDVNSISGAITGGRDSSTGAALFDDLVLATAGIRTADAAFFRGRVSVMLDGKPALGRWGGQFYGNGVATTDIPVSYAEAPGSVAGTFGARVLDGDSLLGVFGAYKESGQ